MTITSEAHTLEDDASPRRAHLFSVPAVQADSVVFKGVGKRYSEDADAPLALHAVNLNIARGQIFGIIGRSGAGKSTLLRLINGLELPSVGEVWVNDSNVVALSEDQLVGLRRRIGMVFQHFNLLSAKTVWENVALPLKIAGVPKREIRGKVDALLEWVGLADKRDSYPAKLSGGQKQRVGIARALVHDPDVLLCDEATSALDPETTQSILALLKDLRRRLGLTIVLITHEMAVIREICDSVAVLEAGQVVETGEVWRVFGAPQHAATRSLLRPLVHDLPAELAARLKPADNGLVPVGAREVLLDLHFAGTTREPDIAALFARLAAHSRKVRVVQVALEPIQGRLQGRLVVSAEISLRALPDAALAPLFDVVRESADRVEVLCYV